MLRYMMIALLASCVAPLPVKAATTYLITYTGTVSSSSDDLGIFGPAGTSLDGHAFEAVFTLTDPSPGYTFNNGTVGYTYGGSFESVASPLSATLTIDGVTNVVSGATHGEADQVNGTGYDLVGHNVSGDNGLDYLQLYVESFTHDIVNSSNYTDPLHYTLQADDDGRGVFVFYGSSLSHFTAGNLAPQTVDISRAPVAAVPEPTAWLMMVGGIGLVGGALRRRNASTSRSIA